MRRGEPAEQEIWRTTSPDGNSQNIIFNEVCSRPAGTDHSDWREIGEAPSHEELNELWDSARTTLAVVEPDGSFDAWMANLSEAEKPAEGLRGPYDTPAGDGMTNLLKYALGLKPMTPSADAAPVAISDGGYLAIELEQSRNAGAQLKLEGSSNLTEWHEIPAHEEIIAPDLSDNRERLRLISDHKIDDPPKYFLRVRVHCLE